MTRPATITVALSCLLAASLVLVPGIRVRVELVETPVAAQAPLTVATLRYSSVPNVAKSANYVVPCCLCDLATMQRFLRDGANEPGSAQFLVEMVAASDGPGGEIVPGHGFSSLRLGWSALNEGFPDVYKGGSCPERLGPQRKLLRWTPVTQAMKDAAFANRVGPIAPLDYTTLTYAGALDYMKAHPGAGALLSTEGREGYVVLAVDSQGRGIVIDHNGRTGPPLVKALTVAEFGPVWERLVNAGQRYGHGRDQFCLVVDLPR